MLQKFPSLERFSSRNHGLTKSYVTISEYKNISFKTFSYILTHKTPAHSTSPAHAVNVSHKILCQSELLNLYYATNCHPHKFVLCLYFFVLVSLFILRSCTILKYDNVLLSHSMSTFILTLLLYFQLFLQ